MGDLRRRAWTVRRYGPGLTCIFLFGVWPRAGLAETPPEPAPAPPTPAAEFRDRETNEKDLPRPLDKLIEKLSLEDDHLAAEQHALDQLLPRNREHDRVLARSRDLIDNKDFAEAIVSIQSLLDAPDDSFTRTDSRPYEQEGRPETGPDSTARVEHSASQPSSLRQSAEALLSDSPEALSIYRQTYEAFASALLTDARAGDIQAARDLLRRFALTPQAAEYSLGKAAILIDAGQTRLARRHLNGVAVRPNLSAQQYRRLSQLISALPAESPTVQTASIQLVAAAFHGTEPSRNPSTRWLGPAAQVDGNSNFADIGPVLSPSWSLRHDECLNTDEENTAVIAAVRRWEAEQLDSNSDSSQLGPQSAVICDGTVIYRDYEGVVARRLNDGSLLWRHLSPGSIRASLDGLEDAGERGLLEARLAIDSVTAELTADESLVYSVERVPNLETISSTRLVAIQRNDGSVAWSYTAASTGQPRAESESPADAPDAHILGVPAPTKFGLMTVVEVRGRVELHAIDRQDGSLLWRQPIAVADVPAGEDRLRLLMSCRPVVADGRVVCGTQLGTIVTVDAHTGSLCWIYNYADVTAGRGGRPRSAASREFNSRAFPNPPLVYNGVVYAMPIQSSELVAVSLESGVPLWTTKRENDLTISLIDEARRQLIVCGDRFVRAIDIADGTERWRTRVPVVVGRGVGIGRHALLPVASGQLVRLDLESGQVCDDRWDRASRPVNHVLLADTGNLSLVDGYVVRQGPISISVMPRSEMVAERANALLQNGTEDQVAQAKLDLARVALASGEPAESLLHLTSLQRDPLSDAQDVDYEHLLRETLFASLPEQNEETPAFDETFEQLTGLAHTADQSARVMKHRIASALRTGDKRQAVSVAKQLAALTSGEHRGFHTTEQLKVSGGQLAGALLSGISADDMETLGLTEIAFELSRFDPQLGIAASDDKTVAARAEFLSLFGSRPEAGLVRVAHASTLLEAGQLQAAELQYLLAIRDGNDEARVQARLALAGLYTRRGLPREAAAVWSKLLTDSEDRYFGGLTVGQLASHIPQDHPVAVAMRQRQPFPVNNYASSIAVRTHDAQQWSSWYDDAQPKMSPLPGAGLDVLDAGKLSESPSISQLILVDQATARIRGRVEVPSYYWHPPSRIHRRAGQVMPIGYYDPTAVSLMEGRVLWAAGETVKWDLDGEPSEAGDLRKVAVRNRCKVKVGPVHPDVCILQQRNYLLAVDPLSGELLWSRNDLDRNSGLWYDESIGLMGDADRTVVFDPDNVGYQIFSTRSGELLDRGRLAPRGTHVRRYRITHSRRVLLIARDGDNNHFRVWDAANPKADPTIDIVAGPSLLIDSTNDGRVGLVDHSSTFHWLDLASGRTLFTCQLPEIDWSHAAGLNVFEQDDMVFVDVAQSNTSTGTQLPLSTTSVRIPSRPIGGNLIAIRPGTDGVGEIAWSSDVGRSTILTGPEYRLPVLLVAARVRPDDGGPEQMKLSVIRAASGELLAEQTDLPRTPLWRWDYDIDNRRVELLGPETTITVRFGGIADVVRKDNQPPTQLVSIER